MKLFENYNNAKQKYGLEIVQKLSNLGIPSQYLLSACRFANEGIKPTDLKHYFKQWMNYVVSNDKTIDVNRLSFEEFYQTIQEYKSSYEVPNKIFDNGAIQIGEFKTFKEANMFPIPNDMCICKTKKWFKYYQSPHSRYLLIYDSRRNDDKRYVLAIIEYGDISYADLSGHEFANSFADQEKGNATQTEFDQYQQSIGKEAVAFLYNIAADVKDKIDNNNDIKTEQYMRRNTIRLTESRLRGMIHEAVKSVLRESSDSVNSQPFGRPEDDTYVPSEEEIRAGNKFFSEHCPWRQWPECETLEGLISWAYHNDREFANGDYSIVWLLYDLYHMS